MDIAYFIRGFLRQPNASRAREYLGIDGAGGGVVLSAGGASQGTGTVIFSNSNNVSFGLNAGTMTASIAAAPSPVNFSAGTTSNNLGAVVFTNSNGVSFGLNVSTISAQHNGITSQSNQAFSAQGGSSAFQTLSFNNANGVTFSNNAGAVEASYTVPSTAGLISAINLSAGTTSNNLSAVTFSNSNGVTFGLNAGTVTASHNGITQQSTQPVAASASNGSFLFSTLGFSNANNVTFGTSAGSIITASVAAPGGGGSVNVSAGTTSNNLTQLVFGDANNVSFGLNGSTVTATARPPFLSAGTLSTSFNTYRFLDSNGISFGMSSNEITASHNGLTSQSNQAVSAANGSFTFQTLSFANSNGVSFSTGTQGIFASVNAGGAGYTATGTIPFQNALLVVSQFGQAFIAARPLDFPCAVQFDRMITPIQFSGATNSTAQITLSMWFALYTRNVNTLSLAHSSSTAQFVTHSGTNNSSNNVGPRNFTMGWTTTIPAGSYVAAIWSRSSTAVANASISNYLMSHVNSLHSGLWGVGSATSAQRYLGWGFFSVTTSAMPASMGVSEIVGQSSNPLRTPQFAFASGTV